MSNVQARGFGLHLTLAHQYPSQLIEASREYGQRLYESIMENARSKIVFSLSLRDRNLTPLADWLYSGTYDLPTPAPAATVKANPSPRARSWL